MSSLIGKSSGTTTGTKGTGYKPVSVQEFTPEQMNLFKQAFSQVGPGSYNARLASGDQSLFDELEAPAMKQFGQLQGNIANKFSGAGQGGRHSSGFQNAQTSAASDFASTLKSQRMSLTRQAIDDLMNHSNQLLNQRPQENFLLPKQQKPMPFWQQFLLGASERGSQMASQAGTAAMMA
ncbi:MAG: hypothetical protein V4708_17045 [Bacteroidota bacterium]